MPVVLRETVSRVEWEHGRGCFRLERAGAPAIARLITPEGEVVELEKGAWVALAAAIGRIFPSGTPQRGRVPADPTRPNAGRPWTSAQDAELAARWTAGETARVLSRDLGRSPGAIAARLVRLGLVDDRAEARLRTEGLTFPARDHAATMASPDA